MVQARISGSMTLAAITLAVVAWSAPARADRAPVKEQRKPLRLPFLKNEGQADSAVAYYVSASAGTVFVTRMGEVVYSLPAGSPPERRATPGPAGFLPGAPTGPGWTLTEKFVGGSAIPTGEEAAVTRVSFFIGNDPARWKNGVETYDTVSLGEVWPGIGLRLSAREGTVEKVFTVCPGSDPSRIRAHVAGARKIHVDETGALVIATGRGDVTFTAPAAYQERGGEREPVAAWYSVRGSEYGVRLGPHDPTLPVVIDPILQSTYAGGTGSFDQISDLSFGSDAWVGGFTNSSTFPGTAGGAQASFGGGNQDGFVARLTTDLTTLKQATFIGGSAYDTVTGIGVLNTPSLDTAVYVMGETTSTDLPGTTGKAHPSLSGGSDIFVAKLNPGLTTIETTYYGGTLNDHAARAMAIGASIYVAGFGESTDLPETAGGAQTTRTSGGFTGFVASFNTSLTQVLQATYVGQGTEIFSLTRSGTGSVYAAGFGGTPPQLAGAAQASSGGGSADAFITSLASDLKSFVRSTYFGGEGSDIAYDVTVGPPPDRDVYISGGTSSLSLPGTLGGAQQVRQGPVDNFVGRFSADLTQLRGATYDGGTGPEGADGIAVNQTTGDVYIAGITSSTKFPGTSSGAQRIYGGASEDAFVVRFNAALTTMLGSTYLGGGHDDPNSEDGDDEAISVRVGPGDNVYAVGYTSATDFPKTAGGAQATLGAGTDGFATRLTPDLASLFAPQALIVDPAASGTADGNGVLEPGERVSVQPAWKNATTSTVSLTGAASNVVGPAGATYAIPDAAASYGSLTAGATSSCSAGPNCYSVSVSSPGTRPAAHWDVTFIETPTPDDAPMKWTLHVGDSFTDVPRSYPFYRKIETLFHNGITLGCTPTQFCLSANVPRINMAIFIARAIAGGAGFLPDRGQDNGVPYSCTFSNGVSLFSDIPPTDPGCPAVHYLGALNVAFGCSAGLFCTTPNVTRGEMAIFMARGVVAPGGGAAISQTYGPDPTTGRSYSCNSGAPNLHFTDVAAADLFCKHVHFLWAKGIIDGCGGAFYCPGALITRGEMAKFLSNSFALPLYGP